MWKIERHHLHPAFREMEIYMAAVVATGIAEQVRPMSSNPFW